MNPAQKKPAQNKPAQNKPAQNKPAQNKPAPTRSMTGTGAASGATEVGELRIDLRALNGRALQLKQRLCNEVAGLEAAFEAEVRNVVHRGSVTLSVERAQTAIAGGADAAQLKALVRDLRDLARELGLPEDLSLRDVLALASNARVSAPRELPEGVTALLRQALADLDRHRGAEGARTVEAMRAELLELDRLRAQAAARAPAIVDDFRDRLLQRVRDFVESQGLQLSAADVVREVALFAERADVSEELQRLAAHLGEVTALLDAGGVLGRKLEFLLQELLREANTLGSKSPDVEMAHCVVAMKAAIDRLKEQAANLE